MNCILLIGSSGLIGSKIKTHLEESFSDNKIISVDQSQIFDLRDRKSIVKFFKSNQDINYILNCSGLNDHVASENKFEINKTDLADLDNFMQINVKSVCWLIEDGHTYLPAIKGIVNFSSLYGVRAPFTQYIAIPSHLAILCLSMHLKG